MSKFKLENLINKFKDFPVFQYWDFNRKEFEPRALNKLSVRFNWSLARAVEVTVYEKEFKTVEELKWFVVGEVVHAAKYALFGNASYEADGPNSYGGGDDSIQEQFVCWALDKPVDDYRNGKLFAYSPDLYKSEVIYKWVETSDFYHFFFSDIEGEIIWKQKLSK